MELAFFCMNVAEGQNLKLDAARGLILLPSYAVRRARTTVKHGTALPARPHQLKLGFMLRGDAALLSERYLFTTGHPSEVPTGVRS